MDTVSGLKVNGLASEFWVERYFCERHEETAKQSEKKRRESCCDDDDDDGEMKQLSSKGDPLGRPALVVRNGSA